MIAQGLLNHLLCPMTIERFLHTPPNGATAREAEAHTAKRRKQYNRGSALRPEAPNRPVRRLLDGALGIGSTCPAELRERVRNPTLRNIGPYLTGDTQPITYSCRRRDHHNNHHMVSPMRGIT
jgi:hypothetical protein